jgi:hypothetical protein
MRAASSRAIGRRQNGNLRSAGQGVIVLTTPHRFEYLKAQGVYFGNCSIHSRIAVPIDMAIGCEFVLIGRRRCIRWARNQIAQRFHRFRLRDEGIRRDSRLATRPCGAPS